MGFGAWRVGKRNKYEKHLKRYASAEKINAKKQQCATTKTIEGVEEGSEQRQPQQMRGQNAQKAAASGSGEWRQDK